MAYTSWEEEKRWDLQAVAAATSLVAFKNTTSCASAAFSNYSLSYVNRVHDAIEGLWTKSLCNNCVRLVKVRNTTEIHFSNDTMYFRGMLENFRDCVLVCRPYS